jgi:hypothetical protein
MDHFLSKPVTTGQIKQLLESNFPGRLSENTGGNQPAASPLATLHAT